MAAVANNTHRRSQAMAHLTPVPDPSNGDAPQPLATEGSSAKSRPRTTHPLPTDRIAYNKQLEVIRAFAVAAADNGGVASNPNVADLTKMSHHTVALATPFFVDAGLLSRADRGRFRPSDAVTEYSRAHQWSPDRAGAYLAPLFRKAWFGQVILSRVAVTAREEDEILIALSAAAGASPEHRQQLSMVIDFAVLSGIVARSGTQLVAATTTTPASGADQESGSIAPVVAERPKAGSHKEGVSTDFSQDPTEGYVEFHVNVKMRTTEFATWRPERISAFFGGIAQVLAAKGRIEEDAGSS